LKSAVTTIEDLVTAITLPVGSQAIEAQVPPNYTKERFAGAKGDSGNAYYTHEIDLLIPNTVEGKKFVKENKKETLAQVFTDVRYKKTSIPGQYFPSRSNWERERNPDR